MNYITYDEGVKLTLNWNYKKLLCVAFVEDDCDACDSFFELVCPELEEMGIEVRCIDSVSYTHLTLPTTHDV